MKRSKVGLITDYSRSSNYNTRRGDSKMQGESEISQRQVREAQRMKERRYSEKSCPQALESSPSPLSDETDYLNSECRTGKIDSHLMTLKKLREKALRYTNQLDEIRTATKKREKELSEVMDRLQQEEKNLHHKLEHIDHLNHRVTVKKNQLRQDQVSMHQEEQRMSEKLQSLKEKEIFVNCQMVKLQSQEAAIKHRKKELQRERLRIEKLAYLIFKTDLSATTYREFNNRIARMQQRLEKRYRKLKVLEHYCQHKSLPVGMRLEPITPTEQNLDPALTAFEEALWGMEKKNNHACENRTNQVQVFNNISSNFGNSSHSAGLTSNEHHAHPITNREISDKESFLNSSATRSICAAPNTMTDGDCVFSNYGESSIESKSTMNKANLYQSSCSCVLTPTKRSKSEQEGQIVKQASSHMQRLVMSAKETCASAFRLLQTPVPNVMNDELLHHEDHQKNIQVILANKSQSPQSNPDPDSFLEEGMRCENHADDSDLYSGPEDNGFDYEDEGLEGRRRDVDCTNNMENRFEVNKTSNLSHMSTNQQQDDRPNVLESLFYRSATEADKVSSHSVVHPEPRSSVPFKYRRKTDSFKNVKAEGNNDPDQPPESRRSLLSTPPPLPPKESSKSKTQSLRTVKPEDKTGHDGDRDRFSLNYDAIVQEQLLKLSENTRNEILYAIGQKALSHVAQVIGKASGQISSQSPSNPATHTDSFRRPNPALPCRMNIAHREDLMRKSMKNSKTVARKIPSHLKFGNFNIRHRNRFKDGDSSQHFIQHHNGDEENLPKMRTSETQTYANENSISKEHSEQKFPEGNFTVGIIAEKILGILPFSSSNHNDSGQRDNNINSRASHTRAFRV